MKFYEILRNRLANYPVSSVAEIYVYRILGIRLASLNKTDAR